MLERMADITVVRPDPVHAFGVRFRCERLLRRLGGDSVDFIHIERTRALVLGRPSHFLRDEMLGFRIVAVFFEQFHVFVRAGVRFLHQLFVVELVPLAVCGRLVLLRFQRIGQFLHEP